ncbi:unnamed protein product [Oppiella nova]|uniref:CCDC174 alpha/beta GRSR domain-containing protein n=1 Tax=Oppiella nova TaxID=334625 RepID=A0A7R9QER2_9ACAR|nr:unnamed protein product [Oppiella nova]CAG2163881.1 unnamed protein product [Oppiella nova]
MNEGKLIDGNMSSMIDLKAELYRKQEAFRLKKLSSTQRQLVEDNDNLYANTNQTKYKLGKRIRQKNDHELRQQRLQTSVTAKGRVTELSEELAEEEKALKRSREMLEMKSRLYEKWTQNPDLLNANKDDEDLDEDIDDRILVDFHRKAYEDVRTKSDSKSEPMIENNDKETEEEEEEWTEFVDSLGRSRKCLKKDLQHFVDIDRQSQTYHRFQSCLVDSLGRSRKCLKKDLQHFVDIDRQSFQRNTTVDKSDIPSVPELSSSNELLSDDLRREIERRNWETGARNELTGETDGPQRDNLNVHYQSVKRNEIRDHGVAYYAFSEDQQTRQQQMDLLNQMREQTKTQKQQKQNLKQKRKQLLRQRLAKVAQRKGIALEVKESSTLRLLLHLLSLGYRRGLGSGHGSSQSLTLQPFLLNGVHNRLY